MPEHATHIQEAMRTTTVIHTNKIINSNGITQFKGGINTLLSRCMNTTSQTNKIKKEKLLCRFGLIGDIQYADEPDGYDFKGNRVRRYRQAIRILEEAIQYWNLYVHPLHCVIQIGDIIDGKNFYKNERDIAMKRTTNLLRTIHTGIICNVIGNHELYNYFRCELQNVLFTPGTQYNQYRKAIFENTLKIQKNPKLYNTLYPRISTKLPLNNITDIDTYFKRPYYSYIPHSNVRIIILDSYQISLCKPDAPASRTWYDALQKYNSNPNIKTNNNVNNDIESLLDPYHKSHGTPFENDSEFYKFSKAVDIINQYNPNVYINPQKNWMENLPNDKYCYIPYNGALGTKQIEWLEDELQQVQNENQRAIIVTHVPLDKRCSSRSTVAWDSSQVLEVLHKYVSNIIVCIYGHYHRGGYCIDEHGLHHFTPAAPIECQPDTSCFAYVDIYLDHLEVCGFGDVRSIYIPFKSPL